MDSDTETYSYYDILVLRLTGWVRTYYSSRSFDEALSSMIVMIQTNQDDAFRLIESVKKPNGFSSMVIAEHYPEEDHGPVNEPISWLEEGF